MRRPTPPERGDIVWLDLNPQAGREQGGRRPALVITPLSYNEKVGLALMCPITSQVKGYPFEVLLAPGPQTGLQTPGAILCDHIRSLDWQVRGATRAGSVPPATMKDVSARLVALISPDD